MKQPKGLRRRDLNLTEKQIEQFWSKMTPNPLHLLNPHDAYACWLWIGKSGHTDYHRLLPAPKVNIRGKTRSATRVAYVLHHKTIRANQVIKHLCGNPGRCCNPHHMITRSINQLQNYQGPPANFSQEGEEGEPLNPGFDFGLYLAKARNRHARRPRSTGWSPSY